MKSDGVIIAEIRVFADGDWEYTGNTKAISGGPDGWDSTKKELACVIDYGIKYYQQFEILGALEYVYKKSGVDTMEVIMDLAVDCLRTTPYGTEQRNDMEDKLNIIERKHRNNKTAWKQALEAMLEETA